MRKAGLVMALAALMTGWPVAGLAGPDGSARQKVPAPALTLHASQVALPDGMAAHSIDANLVVGGVEVAEGIRHAAVVDLSASPLVAQDLGTLGGDYSWATAVHGSLVAGTSRAADGSSHAFVVDTSDPYPTMRDLGTVPGADLFVSQVSDRWVVGTSDRFDPSSPHGAVVALFVVDLASPQPQVKDVGTLGGLRQVQVAALDGGVIAGRYFTPRQFTRAFVYDAEAAQPHFVKVRPLERQRGSASDVVDVSGRLVLGTTDVPRTIRTRVFVYDVDTRQMRLLDPRAFFASAIDGSIVVGDYTRRADDDTSVAHIHAFAYDLSAARPRLQDLDPRVRDSDAWDIDGNLVVGLADLVDFYDAVVYDLTADAPGPVVIPSCNAGASGVRYTVSGPYVLNETGCVLELGYTAAPVFSVSRLRQNVQEDTGTVTFVVRRGGDTNLAASVGYRTWSVPEPIKHYRSRAGQDYRARTGRLDFAPGETSKTVQVRVRDDAKPEPYECFTLMLESPSDNAVVGTPSMSEVVIAPSDTSPDLWIGPAPSDAVRYVPAGYLGNNVYNDTGAHQTLTTTARPGQTRDFFVRLYDDGRSWSGTGNSFTLHATQPRGLEVRYRLGHRDVTDALLSHRGLTLVVNVAGEWRYDTYREFRVSLTPQPGTSSADLASMLTATWKGDGVRTDAVKAVVHVGG